MKKRLLGLLMVAGTLMMLLTSCEYDFITPTPPTPTPPADDPISYSIDIQPIFNSNCVSCHKGSIPPDLTAAKSYAQLVPTYVIANQPETSELYIVCAPGGSMATHTSAEELNLIYRWIYAGAKNN